MNLKNILLSGIAGFIVYFLLGWVFYGQLFTDLHPHSPDTNMMFIALGCLFFAFQLSFIFCQWAGFTNWMSGLKAGAIIGFLGALSMLFFMYSNMPMDSGKFMKEMIATVVSSALTGAAIAFVNGKMTSN